MALEQLLWSSPGLRHIKVANYDGDTPQERRAGSFTSCPVYMCTALIIWLTEIRESASVIFTNFVSDMRYGVCLNSLASRT